jgi:gluconolactonase
MTRRLLKQAAIAAAAGLLAGTALAESAVTPQVPGVVSGGTPIELIKEGFNGTEGPIALSDGSLVFTETAANRITRIRADGSTAPFLEQTNGSNALAFAPNGDLYSVQVNAGQTRVGVIYPPERARVLVNNFEGKPFGRPNDLVLAKNGSVYFTDSGAPRAPGQTAPADVAPPAVYRITPQGTLERLAADIERPNGIQLSPDEKVLYVANTAGEHVLAYDVKPDGSLGPRRNFAKLAGFRQTENGPSSGADGLAVDTLGRLYVATSAGIQVFDAAGAPEGVIALPKPPQNLAFAGTDKRSLYVVGRGSAWRIATLTPGYTGRAK